MKMTEIDKILDESLPKPEMSLRRKVFIVTGVILAVPVLIIALFLYSLTTLDSEQEVAGKITVGPEWIKLTPTKALAPEKQDQEIVLDVDPAEGLVRDNDDFRRIRLTNGTTINPELQIVDDQGTVYTSTSITRYPTPSLYENGISCAFYDPHLPRDRIYTEVRVKCDKPLRLSRIVWHCHTGK